MSLRRAAMKVVLYHGDSETSFQSERRVWVLQTPQIVIGSRHLFHNTATILKVSVSEDLSSQHCLPRYEVALQFHKQDVYLTLAAHRMIGNTRSCCCGLLRLEEVDLDDSVHSQAEFADNGCVDSHFSTQGHNDVDAVENSIDNALDLPGKAEQTSYQPCEGVHDGLDGVLDDVNQPIDR
ncbi:hypothetical protein AXG93_2396s1310 [Marchantia polymorpha subsp. ruderalis]|uniref:Uncharacterized protein n=1 Tax=Marchantia polymorpha subsp. ruderalis TaxID=1480154 RepID=A0A176VDA5_MARPO|nr:hypothetical protein AXG93_2396s1310 [Marchantia polymorpha subsp. ruderalis]